MRLDRRQLYKVFAAAGLALWQRPFLQAQSSSPSEESSDACESANIDIIQAETAITAPSERVYMWISGQHFEQTNLRSRATIAVLLKYPQQEGSYIDKIVFADGEKRTLGVRYLEPSDKISSGYPPYLLFHNVDLTASKRFYLVFQQRQGAEIKIFRKTLSDFELQRSRLNGPQLPAAVRYDLDSAHGGLITCPMQFPTKLIPDRVAQHSVRARLLELSADQHFTLKIDFLHEDVDANHFMRYFLVTDPVGRLLGLRKRNFNDGQKEHVLVSSLTEEERNLWGLTKDHIAKINDCPYLMIFIDDFKEALAQTTLWLR